MGILWTIIIGFIAGVIAKFIMPGDNEPSGFIMTSILGIVGSIVASYLGAALGWYKAGEGAGFATIIPSHGYTTRARASLLMRERPAMFRAFRADH